MGTFDVYKWEDKNSQMTSKEKYNNLLDAIGDEFSSLSFFSDITKYKNNVLKDANTVIRVGGNWKALGDFKTSSSDYPASNTYLQQATEKIMLLDGNGNEGILTLNGSTNDMRFFRKTLINGEVNPVDINTLMFYDYSNYDNRIGEWFIDQYYSAPNKIRMYQVNQSTVRVVIFFNGYTNNSHVRVYFKEITLNNNTLSVSDFKDYRDSAMGNETVKAYGMKGIFDGASEKSKDINGTEFNCIDTIFPMLVSRNKTDMETYIDYDFAEEQLFVKQIGINKRKVIGFFDLSNANTNTNPFYLLLQYQDIGENNNSEFKEDMLSAFTDVDSSLYNDFQNASGSLPLYISHYRVYKYKDSSSFYHKGCQTSGCLDSIEYGKTSGIPLNFYNGETLDALISILSSDNIILSSGKLFVNSSKEAQVNPKALITSSSNTTDTYYLLSILSTNYESSPNRNKSFIIMGIKNGYSSLIGKDLPYKFLHSFKAVSNPKSLIATDNEISLFDNSNFEIEKLYNYVNEPALDTTYINVSGSNVLIATSNFFYHRLYSDKEVLSTDEKVLICYPNRTTSSCDDSSGGKKINLERVDYDNEGIKLSSPTDYNMVLSEDKLLSLGNTFNTKNKVIGYLKEVNGVDVFVPV